MFKFFCLVIIGLECKIYNENIKVEEIGNWLGIYCKEFYFNVYIY